MKSEYDDRIQGICSGDQVKVYIILEKSFPDLLKANIIRESGHYSGIPKFSTSSW